MPTGRRRQFTSSVKQPPPAVDNTDSLAIRIFECSAIFCIGSVYRKARLFIDVQKCRLKRNNFVWCINILVKFLLVDSLSRKVWQNGNPIWRSQSVGRKQCDYLRNRARYSEFIMAAVTNGRCLVVVNLSDLAANAGVKPEEIIRDHRGNYGESSERRRQQRRATGRAGREKMPKNCSAGQRTAITPNHEENMVSHWNDVLLPSQNVVRLFEKSVSSLVTQPMPVSEK